MYSEFMENTLIWINFLLCNVNTILAARDQIISNLKPAHLNTIKLTACITLKKKKHFPRVNNTGISMSIYYTSNYLKSIYTLTTQKYQFSHIIKISWMSQCIYMCTDNTDVEISTHYFK